MEDMIGWYLCVSSTVEIGDMILHDEIESYELRALRHMASVSPCQRVLMLLIISRYFTLSLV